MGFSRKKIVIAVLVSLAVLIVWIIFRPFSFPDESKIVLIEGRFSSGRELTAVEADSLKPIISGIRVKRHLMRQTVFENPPDTLHIVVEYDKGERGISIYDMTVMQDGNAWIQSSRGTTFDIIDPSSLINWTWNIYDY